MKWGQWPLAARGPAVPGPERHQAGVWLGSVECASGGGRGYPSRVGGRVASGHVPISGKMCPWGLCLLPRAVLVCTCLPVGQSLDPSTRWPQGGGEQGKVSQAGACFAHCGLRHLSGPWAGASVPRSVPTGRQGHAALMPVQPSRREKQGWLAACPGNVPRAAFAAGARVSGLSERMTSRPSPGCGDTGLKLRHTCPQSRRCSPGPFSS